MNKYEPLGFSRVFFWGSLLTIQDSSKTSPRRHISVIFLLFLRDFRPRRLDLSSRRTWLTRCQYRWSVAQPVGWWLLAGSHDLDAAIQLIETSIRLRAICSVPSGKHTKNYGKSPCFYGIEWVNQQEMAIFNSYVCLPEGTAWKNKLNQHWPQIVKDSRREASDAPGFCWKYPEICSYLGGKNTQGPTPLIIFGLPKKNQMVSYPLKKIGQLSLSVQVGWEREVIWNHQEVLVVILFR